MGSARLATERRSLAVTERHLKAPPSRKEREKGRAPAFVCGESLGQPPLLPSNLDFGDQQVGTTSQPQVVTLTNHGTAAVEISRVHFTGKNPRAFAQTNTCGTSVPAGGSCSISVTFTPESKEPKTATLDMGDNGGGSPQTVAVGGTGT